MLLSVPVILSDRYVSQPTDKYPERHYLTFTDLSNGGVLKLVDERLFCREWAPGLMVKITAEVKGKSVNNSINYYIENIAAESYVPPAVAAPANGSGTSKAKATA
jgi:hypothetical protein